MKINYPAEINKFNTLKVGDKILFTGTIYTARDQAHLRLLNLYNEKKEMPLDFNGSIIYYAGPTPTKPGEIVGSIGPTTSSRMDKFAHLMKPLNVFATIGKGERDDECVKIYQNDKILYFIVTGGIGALLSTCVVSATEVAFPDLGPESIKKLEVKDFPMILAIDYHNNYIFGGKND